MDDPAQTNPQPDPSTGTTPAVNKEIEGGISLGEPLPLKDIGTHEIDLPKEVVSVGVAPKPTSVKLPPAVQQLGVRASGGTVPSSQAPAVALPLTDDQIAQGLKHGITSSWRWLAEWCVRQLKQLHKRITHA